MIFFCGRNVFDFTSPYYLWIMPGVLNLFQGKDPLEPSGM